jgi:hypothetical protein
MRARHGQPPHHPFPSGPMPVGDHAARRSRRHVDPLRPTGAVGHSEPLQVQRGADSAAAAPPVSRRPGAMQVSGRTGLRCPRRAAVLSARPVRRTSPRRDRTRRTGQRRGQHRRRPGGRGRPGARPAPHPGTGAAADPGPRRLHRRHPSVHLIGHLHGLGCRSRSGSTWTAGCGPRSWRCQPTPGSRPSTPTVATGTAPRSPSWPPWTCRRRAGHRATGRSAGGSGASWRPADLYRRPRLALPGLHHRPARPRHGPAGARHRQHARVEDRIRGAKATGARNLPFDRWRRNAVWLQLVLLALDLVGWAQALLPDGDLAVAEPRTLRYRLWHIAGRLSRHARRSGCACSAPGRGRPTWSARSPALDALPLR